MMRVRTTEKVFLKKVQLIFLYGLKGPGLISNLRVVQKGQFISKLEACLVHDIFLSAIIPQIMCLST